MYGVGVEQSLRHLGLTPKGKLTRTTRAGNSLEACETSISFDAILRLLA
jgi:hypothetical protein